MSFARHSSLTDLTQRSPYEFKFGLLAGKRIGFTLPDSISSRKDSQTSYLGHAADSGSPSGIDRKSTRLNSSHLGISYAVFCLKKKKKNTLELRTNRMHRSSQPHTWSTT